jgi:D-alanyl-D-alanine carboxypeptidase
MAQAMTLIEKQHLFMRLLGEFLVWVYQQPGYALAGGELQRKQAQALLNAAAGVGIANSLHLRGLAIDLMLFIEGVYQTNSEAYRPLGEKWKSMHPLARWGGDFKDPRGNPKPDGDHFSIEHEGVR